MTMDRERWNEIDRLFQTALDMEPSQREQYLEENCRGDDSLRKEVETLLADLSEAEGILKCPALDIAARSLAREQKNGAVRNLIGCSLSHYRIVDKLGAGGMGEVYRAEDSILSRQVAIKVLPDVFSGDLERLARFEREARLLASLNHSNIATLHGLEESGGKRFIVMELVDGETLAQRLLNGPLPVNEALELCRQIAEGLEAAHEKGVIHRDLKPANIMITPNEKVKILDFGLAKALATEQAATAATQSPTITEAMARAGTILGTAAYMSPEQAKGKAVDKRADIWAFGCILYECLTGQATFKGDTVSETLAKILEGTPEWNRLPSATPWRVRELLRRCLEKNPRERLHDIADARLEIEGIPAGPAAPEASPRRPAHVVPLVIATVIAGVVLASYVTRYLVQPRTQPVVRSTIELASGTRLTRQLFARVPVRTELALSPDGRHLVFSASGGGPAGAVLYARALDGADPEPLKGTEGARQPFFSPDGNWIGFWANGKLWKVPRSGGIPKELTECRLPKGTFWAENGKILWGGDPEGLKWIPAEGGSIEVLTRVDENREAEHVLPFLLPGGNVVLFTVRPDKWSPRGRVEAAHLSGVSRKVLIEDAADARYLPTGHIVFVRQGMLMAASFDPSRLETGPASPVVDGVEQALNIGDSLANSGAGQFSVSSSGTLAYASGGVRHYGKGDLVWVSRNGQVEALEGFQREEVNNQVRLSPDGRLLAFGQQDGSLWLFDLERTTYTPLSRQGMSGFAQWNPNGQQLTLSWSADGRMRVWQLSVGSESLEPLAEDAYSLYPSDWSSDGRFLALVQVNGKTSEDILIYHAQDRKVVPFLQSPSSERYPEFSPDGRWLVYVSNETGRPEVYLQSFPEGSRKFTVSSQGGDQPCWASDGRELFYVSLDPPRMMRVSVGLGPDITLGRPHALFDFQFVRCSPVRGYDLRRDGRRFLFTRLKQRPQADITRLTLVLNWTEELKRLVPAR